MEEKKYKEKYEQKFEKEKTSHTEDKDKNTEKNGYKLYALSKKQKSYLNEIKEIKKQMRQEEYGKSKDSNKQNEEEDKICIMEQTDRIIIKRLSEREWKIITHMTTDIKRIKRSKKRINEYWGSYERNTFIINNCSEILKNLTNIEDNKYCLCTNCTEGLQKSIGKQDMEKITNQFKNKKKLEQGIEAILPIQKTDRIIIERKKDKSWRMKINSKMEIKIVTEDTYNENTKFDCKERREYIEKNMIQMLMKLNDYEQENQCICDECKEKDKKQQNQCKCDECKENDKKQQTGQ